MNQLSTRSINLFNQTNDALRIVVFIHRQLRAAVFNPSLIANDRMRRYGESLEIDRSCIDDC